MPDHHSLFPAHRPLVIAHRAGNCLDLAREAVFLGADMIETDVWRFRSRLEIRHLKTAGPLPILWDRWEVHPGWHHRLQLEELALGLPPDVRLFLDLKGNDLALGPAIIELLARIQPQRELILCGRNWEQLDPLRDDPKVTLFYSVGSDEELARIWSRLDKMAHPAISIHCRYLTPENVASFKELGTTIVTWPINTFALARELHDRHVDGFTTDNLDLIKRIAQNPRDALIPEPHLPGA